MKLRNLFLASLAIGLGCDDSAEIHETEPVEVNTASDADAAPPFAVGTARYDFVDADRTELATAELDDRREIVVRVWYPAELAPEAAPAPYFLNAVEGQLNATLSGLAENAFQGLPTRSRIGVSLAASESAFPVLIFSPGMGTPTAFYTRALEDLASRGYVVFALSHAYATGIVVFADGRIAPELPEAAEPEVRDASVDVWSHDQRFVADQLEALARPGSGDRFAGRLDLARLGVFGHSRGGAAATQSCFDDERFTACANLDGSVSTQLQGHAIPRPFLLMRSEVVETTLDPFFAAQRSGARQLFIEGAGHNSFSDLPLVAADITGLDSNQLLLGTIEPQQGFEIISEYTAAFFGAELSGISTELFNPPSVYAEVDIESR